MPAKLSAPITVQWELTPWCPNKCGHCYNFWRSEFYGRLCFSEEDGRIHKAAAEELAKNRVLHVTLTGGEPLAAIRQFAPYIRIVRDSGADLHLNSTLIGLTPRMAELLLELGIHSVLVSLIAADGDLHNQIAHNTHAYERTMAGINVARAFGFTFGINMVVTKKNRHAVRETGMLAKRLGATSFSATKAAAPTNCPDFSEYRLSREEFEEMLADLVWLNRECGVRVDSLEHYPACSFADDRTRTMFSSRSCTAGKTVATIGFDGSIRPCSHAHLVYGNVAETGLRAAWEAMDVWRNGGMAPAFCRTSCPAYGAGICGGGCRTDAHAEYGDITAPDPYCRQQPPTTTRRKKPLLPIPPGSTLQVCKGVKFRPEEFGSVMFASSIRWAAIDQRLLRLLTSQSTVVVRDVAVLYNATEEDAGRTLGYLLSRGLLEVV